MVEISVKETQLRGVWVNHRNTDTEWVDPGVYTVGRESMFDGQLHTLIERKPENQRSFWVLTMHLHTAITGNPKPDSKVFDLDFVADLIRQHGLAKVLRGLAELCFDKAGNVANRSSVPSDKQWEKAGDAIVTMLNRRTWPS